MFTSPGRWILVLTGVAGFVSAVLAEGPARSLSFSERVQCQRGIEEVYWNHRIWPAENPGPKPSFRETMPDAVIRSRVEESLRFTKLLDSFWDQPVRSEDLQVEIERMVHQTKAPDTLRELFSALGNDPLLIAECLARPMLAERLAGSAFSRDERIHGPQRAALESELQKVLDLAELERLDGEHSEITFVLDEKGIDSPEPAERAVFSLRLNRSEWDREIERLAASFFGPPETAASAPLAVKVSPGQEDSLARLPVGRVSGLLERGDCFVVLALRSRSATSVTVHSVLWPKRALREWAREATSGMALDSGAIVPPASGYRIPALILDDCPDDTWNLTAGSDFPDERYIHTAIWTGSEMIVWGGMGASDDFNNGGRYNPTTDSWSASSMVIGTGVNLPSVRAFHKAVWTGTEMIVWGGQGRAGILYNNGGRYNPSTDTWADCSLTTGAGENVPSGRYLFTSVWTGSEMIVWGGWDSSGISSSGGRYNPLTDTWASCSLTTGSGERVPSPRTGHTAIWTGSEMIIWGGNGSSGFINTGGRYNPETDTWAVCSLTSGTGSNVPSLRQFHTAVWTGTEMIIWGGSESGHDSNSGGRYNPASDTWAACSLTSGTGSNVPTVRHLHTAVWTGTEMIIWGGRSIPKYYNTGGRYNPSTDSWATCSLTNGTGTNVPEGRYYHTGIWTGSEMIVWGGGTLEGQINTGGRYNPVTDKWATSLLVNGTGGNVPSARQTHTAIWTGSEMIVWAGSAAGTPVKTGGIYNPATNSWTSSSLTSGTGTNNPVARGSHTAIWTGTEMIVWGGAGTKNFKNGGRYNPATDSWASCSLTTGTGSNVPAARYSHTAIWTGTEMIVWGGYGGSAYLNTGGRYNPSTDTWANCSLVTGSGDNVPTRRAQHTAIWTGVEMIIWGGANATTVWRTGGRYDSSTDTWRSSILSNGASPGTPEARYIHSAVWTGSEMIVWGGRDDTIVFKTGGRFNPTTDAWVASSLSDASGSNVPAGRYGHTAVWTESEMVVWGGYDNSQVVFNNGGRFNPDSDAWSLSSLTTGSGEEVPWGRFGHTAVWTGPSDHRLIVWGGTGDTHTGGLYCAACTAQTWYRDQDGDQHGDAIVSQSSCAQPAGYVHTGDDCDDASGSVWGRPGEALMLTAAADRTTLNWVAPMTLGGAAVTYDVLRSNSANDFQTLATCLATGILENSVTDAEVPWAGAAFFYLARAKNACPEGRGPLGFDSNGTEIPGRDCP